MNYGRVGFRVCVLLGAATHPYWLPVVSSDPSLTKIAHGSYRDVLLLALGFLLILPELVSAAFRFVNYIARLPFMVCYLVNRGHVRPALVTSLSTLGLVLVVGVFAQTALRAGYGLAREWRNERLKSVMAEVNHANAVLDKEGYDAALPLYEKLLEGDRFADGGGSVEATIAEIRKWIAVRDALPDMVADSLSGADYVTGIILSEAHRAMFSRTARPFQSGLSQAVRTEMEKLLPDIAQLRDMCAKKDFNAIATHSFSQAARRFFALPHAASASRPDAPWSVEIDIPIRIACNRVLAVGSPVQFIDESWSRVASE